MRFLLLLRLVGQQLLILRQNIDHKDQRAERDEQIRHVERGEPRDADHVDDKARGDAVDEIADRAAGDGRDAPQLRRLFEPLFHEHVDHDREIHRRHDHEQPPRAAQQAQRHAVVRDVVQLEPAGDERDGLPHEIGRSQIFCQLIDRDDRRRKQRKQQIKQSSSPFR